MTQDGGSQAHRGPWTAGLAEKTDKPSPTGYADQRHQERDADLGYARWYGGELHAHLVGGGILPDDVHQKIREAHGLLQSAWAAYVKAEGDEDVASGQ